MRSGASIVNLVPYDPLMPGDVDIFVEEEPAPVPLFDRDPPRLMNGVHNMSDDSLASLLGGRPTVDFIEGLVPHEAGDSVGSIVSELRDTIGATRQSPQRPNISQARSRALSRLIRLRQKRLAAASRQKAWAAAQTKFQAIIAARAAAVKKLKDTIEAAKAAPNDPAKKAAVEIAKAKAEDAVKAAEAAKSEAKSAEDAGSGGGGGGGGGGEAPADPGGAGARGNGDGSGEAAPTAPGDSEEAPADGGEAPADAGEDAAAAAGPEDQSGTDDQQPVVSGMTNGFWVKTRFYQEGHFLKSTTTCVSCGNVDVLNFQVDLRPIAKAVQAYHQRLHTLEKSNSRPAALRSISGDVVGCWPWDCVANAVSAVSHTVKRAVSAIAHSSLIKKIGHGLTAIAKKAASYAGTLTGYDLVKHLIKGERIDHALMGELKATLAVTKDLAPYVQTIVSVVPGIGSGVAAGIAAASAIAEGKKITDVMMAAARGAVPGGALAQTGFDIGQKLVQGKNIVAATLESARSQLGEAGKRAFDVAVALSHGQNLQKTLTAAGGSIIKSQFKIPSPSFMHIGDQTSHVALNAFHNASNIVHNLERGSHAKTMVANAVKAASLLSKTRAATKTISDAKVREAFNTHPGFAQRIRRAMLLTTAVKAVPKHVIQESLDARQKAFLEIAKIVRASKSANPKVRTPALKALEVLKIVAQTRTRMMAIASANAGGIPGMFIDKRGRVIRGNFVAKASGAGAKNVFFSRHGIERGHFTRLPSPTETASRRPPVLSGPPKRGRHVAPHAAVQHQHPAAHSAVISKLRHSLKKPGARVSGNDALIGSVHQHQHQHTLPWIRVILARSGDPRKAACVRYLAATLGHARHGKITPTQKHRRQLCHAYVNGHPKPLDSTIQTFRTTRVSGGAANALIGCPPIPRVGMNPDVLVGCPPPPLVGCPPYRV